ncbi:MAG: hypothetical protein EOM20_18380, partial [Spartobacteria bacterium]|nr:hypothetical protein [Spartobacteria bacterium]
MRGQWITGCLALCVLLSGGAAHAAMTPLEAIEKLDAVCLALQTSFDPKNFSFSALDAIQPEAGESIDILTVLGDIIFHSGHEALPRDIETASPVMQHVMKSILSDTEGQFLFPDSEDPGLETRVVIWRQCLFGGSTWIVALTQPAADHADAGQPHLKKWAGAFTETGTAPTGDALPKRAGSMHMLTFNAGSNFTA